MILYYAIITRSTEPPSSREPVATGLIVFLLYYVLRARTRQFHLVSTI